MKKDIKIRKVKLEDAEQYIKLSNLVWRSAYKNIFPESVFEARESEATVNRMVNGFAEHTINNPNYFSYVAEIDGEIIGLMGGSYRSHYKHFQEDKYADLQGLYIHPDYQHIGLGKRFFDMFTTKIKKKGITNFIIGVLQDNKQARKAYEKWGGKLDAYSQPYVKAGKEYVEVFYTFDLTKEKKLEEKKHEIDFK